MAKEAGIPLITVLGSKFQEKFIAGGVGPARVRDLFLAAKRHAPCIVFIDEIDCLGKTRTDAGRSQADKTLYQVCLILFSSISIYLN